jgi:hypothetical protein
MFCPNCGKPTSGNETFCNSCGAKLGAQPPQGAPVNQPPYPYAPNLRTKELVKSKLGISCQLFGALLYFMGLINVLGLVLLAGYILLFEENKWLKKTAVKATAIVVIFALAGVAVGFLDNIFSAINSMFRYTPSGISWLFKIDSLLSNLIYAAEKVILVVFGFMTLTLSNLNAPGSNVLGNHITD